MINEMNASSFDMLGTVTIDNGAPLSAGLTIEQHYETIWSNTATKPDSRWEHIDSHGHFHAYDTDGKLPTLIARSRHLDCDGTCGGVCEDEGYDITEWFCAICDEQIEPHRIDDREPHDIPTRKDWTIKVESAAPIVGDRVTVRFDMGNGQEMFGVAVVGSAEVIFERDHTRALTALYSASPLGTRSITSARTERMNA